MGLTADAELIWGIPVDACNSEGEPSRFWCEANDDWRSNFEGQLYIRTFGHYEDPDGTRGILTSKRVKPILSDCWEPTLITPRDLDDERTNDKLYSKSEDEARASGLNVSFYRQAGWYLVASYG
jgi:hypothetical protein